MNEHEDLIREIYRLENDPTVAKRELRLFMQHPMSCGHSVGELLTCDTPGSPSGCATCGGDGREGTSELAERVWEETRVVWEVGKKKIRRAECIAIIAAYGKQERDAGYRAGVEEFTKWSDVAFYPGPNESPEFQAGFMTAVDEVACVAAHLLESKLCYRKELPIRISIKRLYGKAFAGYLAGSYKKRAEILVDLHASMNFLVNHPEWTWKEFLSENILHELLHVIEDILGRKFNDEEIDGALVAARLLDLKENPPA